MSMIYLDYKVRVEDPEIGKPAFDQPLSIFSIGLREDIGHEIFAVSSTMNQINWRKGHKRKWDWRHHFSGCSQSIWCSPAVLTNPYAFYTREDFNFQRNYGLRRRAQVLC